MQKEAGLPIPQEVRLFKRIVNCTKGIMPVSMFVIYRTIFIVFGSHKWASENSIKLSFPCCRAKTGAKKGRPPNGGRPYVTN